MGGLEIASIRGVSRYVDAEKLKAKEEMIRIRQEAQKEEGRKEGTQIEGEENPEASASRKGPCVRGMGPSRKLVR